MTQTCWTCRYWGRPPGMARFGFCFAPKVAAPTWAMLLYFVDGTPKVLDRSPLMPDTDGARCAAWKRTRRQP